MLLRLQSCELVELRILAVVSLFFTDRVLIAVQIIGVVPISVVVLRAQTIGIDRGMHRPRMYFFERIILVDEKNPVAIFLKEPGKKCRVHTGTEGTLEVVIVDDRHLGVFVAASRSAADVNFLHRLGIRIRSQIQSRQAQQRFVVVREQEFEILFLAGAGKGHRQGIVAGELTRAQCPHNDRYVRRQRILRSYVALDQPR